MAPSGLWEADEKAIKRAIRRLSLYEKEARMLRKRSEEYEVLEEVFDKPTLLALHELMRSGVFRYLNGVVKAGKESRVYWGVRDGSSVAVKVFLVVAAEFKRRLPYIVGDPRFERVRKGTAHLVELWARKEYRNLLTASEVGVPVPKPYGVKRNVLVMEFIGKDGAPAPLLNEVDVSERDYKRVINIVEKLWKKAKLVHADLSEYNIFKYGKRLLLFDFGSAVDVAHPSSKMFLTRDIININRFFTKRGIEVESVESLLRRMVGPEF